MHVGQMLICVWSLKTVLVKIKYSGKQFKVIEITLILVYINEDQN